MVKRSKATAPYTLRSFVVCDDAREEKSGKAILIGVYSDTAIVKSFPAAIPKLVFRFTGTVHTEDPQQLFFKLVDSDGVAKADLSAPFPQVLKNSTVNTFSFELQPAIFNKATVLNVFFGIDTGPDLIGTFEIRGPASGEEEKRLP